MATGDRNGRGLKDRNISDSAGIRPYKLNLNYASEAAFLAAKGASTANLATAEEGDFFYDTTANIFKFYNGSAWISGAATSAASTLTDANIWVGDGSDVAQEVVPSGVVTMDNAGVFTLAAESVDSDHYVDGSIDNAHLAANSVDSDNYVDGSIDNEHLADDAVGAAELADSAVSTAHVANTAADSLIGAIPVLYSFAFNGGAAASDDFTLTHKTLVTDVWVQHTGGAGDTSDTVQIKNGANAITDAMDWSGADNLIVRAASLNDANTTIAAAGTLRITTVDGDGGDDIGAGIVYVLGYRVA